MNTFQFQHLSKMQLYVLLSFLSLLHIQGQSIQQVPFYACIGDSVDIVCSLSVPDPITNNFMAPQIAFIINGSETFVPVSTVNFGTFDFAGISLTRLTATPDMQGFKDISGNLTILSFMMGDGGLTFGCAQNYFLSGSSGQSAKVNVTLELQSVVLPLALSSPPTHSFISFNQSTCSASVNISWILPNQLIASSEVTYVVYLNGSEITRTMLDSTLHLSTLSASTEYNYSVAAENCAGTTAQVYAASLLTPEFPSAPMSATHSLLSFNQSTCSASVNVSWTLPNQLSASSGVEYVVYLNGSEIARTLLGYYLHVSTLLPTSEYNYSVAASDCIGTSSPVYAPSLLTAEFPSAPISTTHTLLLFNQSTCSASVNVSWILPNQHSASSEVEYVVYLNGSEIARTLLGYYLHVSTLLPTSEYNYSVAASNCIGSSPPVYVLSLLTPVGFSWLNLIRNSCVSQKVLPSAPISTTHSLLSFNQSTCSASVNVSWTLPNQHSASSGVEYVVYLNGSEIARTLLGYYLHVSTLLPTSEYNYSVAASDCIGTSPPVYAPSLLIPEFPSAPISTTHSLHSFNQSTCSASVNVSWTLPNQHSASSGVEYVVYLNGSEIARTLLGYYLHVSTLLPTSEYNYSVAASDCIGTSPPVYAPSLLTPGYNIASSNVSILYNQSSDTVDLHWNLTQNSLQILIRYSLKIDYIYSRDNIEEHFQTNTTLNLLSTNTSYSLQLTRHGFSAVGGISTDISVRLQLMRQCGQVIPDLIIFGFFRATNPRTETTAPNNVTLPGSETALPINVTAAIVLGIIGFLILAFCILTIILIVVCTNICLKMLTKKGAGNEKREEDLELNQIDGDTQTKSPNDSAPSTVYANPEN